MALAPRLHSRELGNRPSGGARTRNPRRRRSLAALVGAAVTALAVSSAQAHDPAFRFRAYGSATVDGVAGAGEWDAASTWNFAANLPPGEGGGTAPATLYVMNDATTLYFAVKVTRPTLGSSSVAFGFDNDHDGALLEEGDDSILLNPSGGAGFYDEFVTRQPPCPPGAVCLGIPDAEVGGTSDGLGAATNNGSFTFYELAHPLDTPDDGHDFSLRHGKRVGFDMSLRFCGPTCADTDSPRYGDIVVTSTSTVPPDTEIAEGPAEGSLTNVVPAAFRFAGSDDVVAPEDLTFECRLDAGGFEPCATRIVITPPDGRHTLAVRASDEVGNVDASPASRTWTIDTGSPSAPAVVGARRIRKPVAHFRLAARDALDPPAALRFRCAVDGRPWRPCRSRLALRLRPGRHVLRVVAVDRAGNRSARTTVRVRRLARRQR